jgi:hypothetical protein
MDQTIVPTSGELDQALIDNAIPAVGWHVASLRLGYVTGKVIPAGTVADHYNANVAVIRAITGATLDKVRSRRDPASIDNAYLIDPDRTAL